MMNPQFEYTGKFDDECSVDDFLSPMLASEVPCQKVFRNEEKYPMKVFWYPSADTVNSKISASGWSSVQEQIKCFLEGTAFGNGEKYVMVQFWIPTRSISGHTVLTVSRQPFAMDRLYKGLCSYRYYSTQQQIDVSSNEVGPIGRVFNGRSAEFCRNIDSYSENEFPMRNYAKYCGIKQYLALPISEIRDEEQQCIGVLEFLFRTDAIKVWWLWFHCILEGIENLQISKHPHSVECECPPSFHSYIWPNMMRLIRSKHGIPLIQTWTPCLCDTQTRLFCHQASTDLHGDYADMTAFYGTHSLENGKGVVGKAYSQTKCCFLEDTSGFSISDYPLIHHIRSFNLTACFAIPLQSVHPRLPPQILEVFLSPLESYDHGNLEALLKSILSTVAKSLSEDVEFKLLESEDAEFDVKFSESDDESYVFFDVHPSFKTGATIGNGGEEHPIQLLQAEDDAASPVALQSRVEASVESIQIEQELEVAPQSPINTHSSARLQTTISIPSRGRGKSTETGDDESEQCSDMTVKATYRDKTVMFPLRNNSGMEELRKEVGKRFKLEVGRISIKYKDQDGEWITLSCREDLKLHVKTLKASHQPTLLLEINTIEEAEITLENINQYRGCTRQEDAAQKLNVSLSTLKRRCKELGLPRWPFSKRKKVIKKTKVIQESDIHEQCSNADATESDGVANGNGIESENDETASHENDAGAADSIPAATNGKEEATRNDEILHVEAAANSVPASYIGETVAARNNIIDVRATYKDDTILFSLSCNPGIAELCKELDDTFQFGAEKFKIKYKHDDGTWITLFRDTHLSHYIDALKASGRSTMKLLVFPDS